MNSNFSAPESESGALGCVLNADGEAGKLLDQLREAHFSDERHLTAFRALLECQADGEPLNVVALVQRLRHLGQIEDAGGLGYISGLPDAGPSPANFPAFLATVEDRAARRARQAEIEAEQRALLDLSRPVNAPPRDGLPDIENSVALLQDDNAGIPPEVVRDVLHLGCKAILGSNSKARKTWALIDLAVSVSAGICFWRWETTKGRVLYLNFEIPRPFMRRRIQQIARAKGVNNTANLDVWNLRGHSANFGQLLPKLARRIEQGKYSLIVIDPIYKGLAGRDENSAGAIGELCNEVERLAVATGAAVVFAAHYAKGNAASKQAVDRISGSGVFTRDADAIITMTALAAEGSFSIELTLRNHPEQAPFAVTWEFPLMVVDNTLNPADLKQSGGRKAEHEAAQLLEVLPPEGLENAEWIAAADEEHGISKRTFYRLRKDLEKGKRILKSKVNGKWQPILNRNEKA